MKLSDRVTRLEASPIRDILAATEVPGMISFAGGLPAAETFPHLDTGVPQSLMQYGATEGENDLRAEIAVELRDRGIDCSTEQVLILSGSQQGIDLVSKLFVDRGTRIALESPTYLAALQVFRFFGAQLLPFEPSDSTTLARAVQASSLVYVIPNFQNPTGRCYSSADRRTLANVCDESSAVLFEDDPYRELTYEDRDRAPIAGLLRRSSWIYQSSFSKTFAPGLRLGYLAASPDLMPYLVRLKQAADLHSNRLSQWYALQQLRDPDRQRSLEKLRSMYRQKRDRFGAGLHRYFGHLASWELPAGGLFFWLKLTSEAPIDTRQLLDPALARGVAFMPGEPFYPEQPRTANALRLNFSQVDEASIDKGLEILARLIETARSQPSTTPELTSRSILAAS